MLTGPRYYFFKDLSDDNKDRARATFFNARVDDEYIYELDMDGKILCRRRVSKKDQPNG